MQPYAVRMHFFGSSRKLGGSRAESTCREPYALYAPLLGVGVFSAFFLLRGSAYGAYGRIRKPSESGLSPTARRHWSLFGPRKPKVHTAVHTAFRPKNPYRPPIDGISQIGIFALHGPPSGAMGGYGPIRRSLEPLAGFRREDR